MMLGMVKMIMSQHVWFHFVMRYEMAPYVRTVVTPSGMPRSWLSRTSKPNALLRRSGLKVLIPPTTSVWKKGRRKRRRVYGSVKASRSWSFLNSLCLRPEN